MAHRALQVLNQVVALHRANTSLDADVHKHRVKPIISEGDAKKSAVIVRLGADQPIDPSGEANLAFIDDTLELVVVLAVDGDDEEAVIDKLLELRTQSHITLQASQTLGLAFVSDCRYQGALAPDVKADAGRVTGVLETNWTVWYRMNLTDPS